MITVGLTGGIGSGKTTVAKMFEELGVPVYYSDIEAKNLMVGSETVKSRIVELLGHDAYIDGILNKNYIANKIFNDGVLLEKMNGIVHPAVREHFKDWRKRKETAYVIQESALIFESGIQEFYDYIVLVVAPEEERIKRVLLRDESASKESVKERIENQSSDSENIELSHFVIENLDLGETRRQVLKIHYQLLSKA
ncbi:dephospho-CoA kinase [Euzebyella marina]|uniref:Dephospho-CoA kinase n=1 Tax=Euzebyella marina TaxID=1761453 RepID=A0A3G2L6I6_9FLAO|nr:dephospho-CoA kinase [Euzebyella marina]AYN67892.1 dephospho-CoA kinase [Euzebyella marina]